MCYPKPGPRCSAHAYKTFRHAHSALKQRAGLLGGIEGLTLEAGDAYNEAQITYDNACWDFYKTPGGQQYIDRMLIAGVDSRGKSLTDISRVQLEESKVRAWDERQADLEALKRSSGQKVVAQHDGDTYQQGAATFLSADDVRYGWDSSEESDLTEGQEFYNSHATAWASNLSVQDKKDLLHWTDDGYNDVTWNLVSGDLPTPRLYTTRKLWQDLSDPEAMSAYVTRMDTVLGKPTVLEKPLVIYRGANGYGFIPDKIMDRFYHPDALKTDETLQADVESHIDKEFTPGKIIQEPVFKSASMNSGVATDFASQARIVFEIKTRKINPVGSFSHHNDKEAEVIIPRNAKFRVVSVQKNVTFSKMVTHNQRGLEQEDKKYTVIQMEEVD